MTIPTNWDPSPLQPVIIIRDLLGVEKFRFENEQVKALLPIMAINFDDDNVFDQG